VYSDSKSFLPQQSTLVHSLRECFYWSALKARYEYRIKTIAL